MDENFAAIGENYTELLAVEDLQVIATLVRFRDLAKPAFAWSFGKMLAKAVQAIIFADKHDRLSIRYNLDWLWKHTRVKQVLPVGTLHLVLD